MHKISINIDERGRGNVLLDGKELAGCMIIEIAAAAGKPTFVKLTLRAQVEGVIAVETMHSGAPPASTIEKATALDVKPGHIAIANAPETVPMARFYQQGQAAGWAPAAGIRAARPVDEVKPEPLPLERPRRPGREFL